ncbi:carbohydrate ABC transporter permease [Enterococcus sp. RIT-PI-f]|uniref:carbohydrate ABC transporter permease n=1 Tax=Enterococcus sp. RIT-PI-f TaxID=1690244 RepID=UPI001F183DB4|nr:sugar ABC transporter permease [Enterococcus sp. RIT-PI-f]
MRKIMRTLNKHKWPLLFTGTSIILFILFFLIPAVLGLYYSLTDYKGFAEAQFIGLANYQELFRDDSFYKALFRTFRYVIVLVPSIYVISLAIALMLNSTFAKGRFLAKIIFFLPWTISGIIAGVIWKWLFGENFGFINFLLEQGGQQTVPWFTDSNAAFAVIVLAAIWGGTAFNMLQFTAALKNIPHSYYEAAEIDGASFWHKLRFITIPMLKPTSFMVILLASIGSMKEFALVQSLTNGGPGTDNMFIVQYIYTTGFDKMRVGYASAASMVLFFILLLLGLAQMKLGGGKNDV